MRHFTLTLSLFLLAAFSTFAVQTREEAYAQAINQITSLKSGVMLVRLSDKLPVIKALEDKGMHKRAKMVKKKQEIENKEIMAAFKNFNFCRVLFFYSSDSKHISKSEFDKVTFYNQLNGEVANVKLDTNFFVADFGMLNTQPDAKTKTELPEETGVSEQKKYEGSDASVTFKCMYLSDHNFNQLASPFPFYSRFSPFDYNSFDKVVKKMNKKLIKFYSSKGSR